MICHNIIERAIVNAGIGKMGPNGIEGVTPKVKTIAIPDPAAGQELSYTVPSGVVLLVQSIFMRLVTDTTIATRMVRFKIENATNVVYWYTPLSSQSESLNVRYFLAPNIPSRGSAYAAQALPLSDPCLLMPGWVFRTDTAGIQAGDQFTNIAMTVIEWS